MHRGEKRKNGHLLISCFDTGDDWFYFEDMSSYGHDDVDASFMATKKDDADLVLRTRSGDVTSLISFAFDEALESKKLHDEGILQEARPLMDQLPLFGRR